jgi:hypothetical protein
LKSKRPLLESLEDYERQAKKVLGPDVRSYIDGSTESGATLARNLAASYVNPNIIRTA